MSTLSAIRDISQVGEARRAAMLLGRQRGMDEEACSSVGIVVTELATNLVRHAGEGTLSMRWQGHGDRAGLEVVVLDRGPGMDVARCMQDGYSSRGTAGNGLGAVRRIADEFDVHSGPGQGTAIVARLHAGPRNRVLAQRRLVWAAYCTPAHGETVCGDLWRVESDSEGHASVLVADGLGHGPAAATASEAVGRVFDRDPRAAPARMLESAHREASSTRGAAVAMASVDLLTGAVRYAGVGNIAGAIIAPGVRSRGLFSHNGTLGHAARKFQEFEYELPVGGLLVMHSDGMQTRWSLDDYPGLAHRDPALVAAVLGRDFKRGHDDLTVVVARLEAAR